MSTFIRDEFIIIDYDTALYPFQTYLATYIFKVKQLETLHLNWQLRSGRKELQYADNLHLRKKMQSLPDTAAFYNIYRRWVTRVLAPHYGDQISYASHPKMRVHLAGTPSVCGFHTDIEVTKRPEQINCYLPFTNVYDSNTLYIETDYGSENYKPLNLNYGQALLWDGGCLKHGTVPNTTSATRVSCDFRFHPHTLEKVRAPWCNVLSARPSFVVESIFK